MDRIAFFDLGAQVAPLREELLGAVSRCLGHQGFCLGPEVEAFEREFADFQGVAHAVGLNNGTSAMHLAARLLDLGPGDEVITTPYTFIATSWPIAYCGATPVFVDIDEATMNLDASLLEKALTPKTKAVFAVHLYGQPCDLDAMAAFCARHGLALVEDAAQAHGARFDGRPVGSDGIVSAFSFYPTKNLGACGEGGALLTNDAALAQRVRALRNHGSLERDVYGEVGYNYRMEGVQAAMLRVKLKRLGEWTAARRRVAHLYHRLLADTPLRLPIEAPGRESVYHLYTVRHPERDALKDHLEREGVGCAVYYPVPLHLQKCFAHLGCARGAFPVAERAAAQCLSLPIYPELGEEAVHRVAAAVHRFFANRKG